MTDVVPWFSQVHQFDFRSKCIYIAVIVRKMLEAMINSEAVDDMVSVYPFM